MDIDLAKAGDDEWVLLKLICFSMPRFAAFKYEFEWICAWLKIIPFTYLQRESFLWLYLLQSMPWKLYIICGFDCVLIGGKHDFKENMSFPSFIINWAKLFDRTVNGAHLIEGHCDPEDINGFGPKYDVIKFGFVVFEMDCNVLMTECNWSIINEKLWVLIVVDKEETVLD